MVNDKKNILVVDFLINRIIFFIEAFGHYNLDVIENSEGAIEYLKSKTYDYVLLSGNLANGDTCLRVAEFLYDNPSINNTAEVIIYTWNLEVADKILSLLSKAKYLPFNTKIFSTLLLD